MSAEFSFDWTLDEFLTRAASSAPTPGGGSIAAYTAAMGFAMLCMVANLSIGRKKDRESTEETTMYEGEARRVLREADAGAARAKEGVAADIRVFEDYMRAYKLPRKTPEEAATRRQELDAAARAAAQVPLSLARDCAAGLRLAVALAPVGNKGALSDVGVAACLLDSALQSAILSVDINLGEISDPTFTEPIRQEREKLLRESEALRAETLRYMAHLSQ
ncbi:MAG: cyclodeaminase/cyclohydrolase family protein [Gracilibacteraceae bacterium]|jgi:formiminotetrahydrofolate cyclodeaminase|nr:cyclodeaminase/cyclohydrolase family protein [Gracilibacteraceae bacterium]